MRVCSSTALASYPSFGFGWLLFDAMLPLLTLCCRFSLDLFAKRACRRNCFLQHAPSKNRTCGFPRIRLKPPMKLRFFAEPVQKLQIPECAASCDKQDEPSALFECSHIGDSEPCIRFQPSSFCRRPHIAPFDAGKCSTALFGHSAYRAFCPFRVPQNTFAIRGQRDWLRI